MELSQLRYFIAVAKLGNMSKAAETLFVSQPNLSTSISRLEEEVGVPLFERPFHSWTPASRLCGTNTADGPSPSPSSA